MLCFIYCGYAKLICRVLASLHSAAFTLSQVKRHTVSAIDHPGSATDKTHIIQLYRVCLTFFPSKYTQSSCPLSPANRFSGRVAVTEYKPYSTVPFHSITLYATYLHLAGSICVIFLVIMAFILCIIVLRDGGYGWQYFRCFLCLVQHAHSTMLYQAPCIIHRTSFYLFLWQPCGCICRHSRLHILPRTSP